TVYAAWEPGLSPSGIRVLAVEGSVARGRYAHESAGELFPSMDGSLLFTARGIYNPAELQLIGTPQQTAMQNSLCVPTADAAYFLAIRIDNNQNVQRVRNVQSTNKLTVGVYTAGDRRLLFTLPEMPEVQVSQNNVYYPPAGGIPISRR